MADEYGKNMTLLQNSPKEYPDVSVAGGRVRCFVEDLSDVGTGADVGVAQLPKGAIVLDAVIYAGAALDSGGDGNLQLADGTNVLSFDSLDAAGVIRPSDHNADTLGVKLDEQQEILLNRPGTPQSCSDGDHIMVFYVVD